MSEIHRLSEVLRFTCPHCQTQLSAGPENAGKTAPCPACGLYLILPGQMLLDPASPPAAAPAAMPVKESSPPAATPVEEKSSPAAPELSPAMPTAAAPSPSAQTRAEPPRSPVPFQNLASSPVLLPHPVSPAEENPPPTPAPAAGTAGASHIPSASLGKAARQNSRLRPPRGAEASTALPFRIAETEENAPSSLKSDTTTAPLEEAPSGTTPDGGRLRLLKAALLLSLLGTAGAALYIFGKSATRPGTSALPAVSNNSPRNSADPADPDSGPETPAPQALTQTQPPPPSSGDEPLDLVKESGVVTPETVGRSLLPKQMVLQPLGGKPSSSSGKNPASRAAAPADKAPVSAAAPARPAAPPSTPLGKARLALDSFLSAADWQERLKFSLDADKLRGPMATHFQTHPDGPIPVEGISFLTEGTIPDSDRPYFGFRVRVRDFPADIPMAVEDSGAGNFLVDWAPFQETYEQRLKAFFAQPVKEPGRFRVVLRRKHYFGPPVPGQDVTRRSFSVESPMRDESWFVWADLQSEAWNKRIDSKGRADWDTESSLVVELVWSGDEKAGRWVTLRDIVADNWQMR